MYDIPIDLKSLEDEIIAYEQEPIVTGKILFYGHSLFTRWKDIPWGNHRLDEDIRGKDGGLACVNHGFGTSTSEELLYFYPRMVRGGVLLLHDYENARFSGVQAAVEAYEQKHGPLLLLPVGDLHGSAMVIHP